MKNMKTPTLRKLETFIEKGEVDKEIIPLLNLINKNQYYYTTSSCSGRVVVAESRPDDNKKEFMFLGKWHRKVKLNEVLEAVKKHEKNILWFRVDPVILHVCCKDMKSADNLLKTAIKSGLKRSGIYQIKPRVMAELIGVDMLSAPIGENGKLLVNEDYLAYLIEIANGKMEKNHKKIEKFMEL